jgi:hypothetical protein
MMPSDAGRRLRRLGFAQAADALDVQVGLCAGRIRGLGLPEVRQAASTNPARVSPC